VSRPRIGITVSRRSSWRIFPMFALNVWFAGGRPLRWDAAEDVDLDAADGAVIGGGDDISPALYGGEIRVEARVDPARDELERNLVRDAMARELPVLGVCRGAQMLNVALGGSLHQDAYAVFGSRKYHTVLPRKTVQVEAGTRLDEIAGLEPMKVNALHSQSVDRLGRGLRIAARDEGGMVQAVERVRDPFALGVQWHPEHIIYARRQRALFRALVVAARARSDRRAQLAAIDRDSF
jgi:putative glutamine amidotransferase